MVPVAWVKRSGWHYPLTQRPDVRVAGIVESLPNYDVFDRRGDVLIWVNNEVLEVQLARASSNHVLKLRYVEGKVNGAVKTEKMAALLLPSSG